LDLNDSYLLNKTKTKSDEGSINAFYLLILLALLLTLIGVSIYVWIERRRKKLENQK